MSAGRVLPVILPVAQRGTPAAPWRAPVLRARHGAVLALVLLLAVGGAEAAAGPGQSSILGTLWRWTPLLLEGFVFNIAISLLAMAIGTVAGLAVGLGLISPSPAVRALCWSLTQLFRNAPWLVLLFFVMFLLPFEFRIGGVTIPFPGWIKATLGFALPVMANTAEIVRGAIQSIPYGQWEAAESLAFSRRRTLWTIILPQCAKRMLPPWMNLYSLVAMATVQASIVGVTEMLTLVSEVHAAEGGRPELLAPLYGYALLCFFLYCYPIGRLTARLERRFQVRI